MNRAVSILTEVLSARLAAPPPPRLRAVTVVSLMSRPFPMALHLFGV